MRELLTKLRTLVNAHKAWTGFLTTSLAIIGVQWKIPDYWWHTKWLSWSINSRISLGALAYLTIGTIAAYLVYRDQKKKISDLEWQLKMKNLPPEEAADLMKEKISYNVRFWSALFRK